jgi:hypothetical protein
MQKFKAEGLTKRTTSGVLYWNTMFTLSGVTPMQI